jgi:hypothetical protein
MPEVLELEQVQMSQTGERQTPDPDSERLKLYRGAHEPPTSVELHQDNLSARATPERLLIGNLNHPRLRLREPINVIITRDDSLLIASIPEIEEFGYGTHLTAAVEDLRQTLIELFQTLKVERSRLGPDMLQLWNQLQVLIEER